MTSGRGQSVTNFNMRVTLTLCLYCYGELRIFKNTNQHFIAVTGATNTFQDSDYYEYSDKIKEYSDQIAFDTVSIALVLPIF